MNEETQGYMDSYRVLEAIAKDLENQDTPDIDKILPKIDEARKAYDFCKSRIEKVKKSLEVADSPDF